MQDRNELNSELNRLKKIFDIIEPYDPEQNTGHRSLKNLGVWLIVYALTDKNEQSTVIKDLLQKSNKYQAFDTIKAEIDSLASPEKLTAIINDYVKANGEFAIVINNPARLPGLKQKANAVGLGELVQKYLKIDTSKECDIMFDMNNMIKFAWKSQQLSAAILDQGKKFAFGNEGEINYLTAHDDDHHIKYDLVKHTNQFYHVVRFGVLQQDAKEQSSKDAVYLIEPADDTAKDLQQNYIDIVNSFGKADGYRDRYTDFKVIAKESKQKNLQISEVTVPKNQATTQTPKFNLIVNFPELKEPLKTEENRLGIYASFLGKTIGSFYAGSLEYLGQRELEYDAKGGTVKNRETLMVYESCMMHPIPAKTITLEYTTKGPYAMVYAANNGADFYFFNIANPRKGLQNHFTSSMSYAPRLSQSPSNIFSTQPRSNENSQSQERIVAKKI